jgi:hypothetical protein
MPSGCGAQLKKKAQGNFTFLPLPSASNNIQILGLILI